jgi:26 proteasome complex subunit DSS1
MSGAAQGGASTTKAVVSDAPNGQPAAASAKPAPQLEEDDEFEDFPVEGASSGRAMMLQESYN